MARTAADTLIEDLIDWGVEVVFGLPGDGINGIMESLRTHQDRIRFIQVRHEESAALAATAYAKLTGRLGVCLATSGPGGLHLINGLYDAKLDGAPVLAITGHHFSDLIETYAQQDVDLTRVFADVSVFNARVNNPAHVANLGPLACRAALAERGVAHICFPTDIQSLHADDGPRARRDPPNHQSDVFARSAQLPDAGDLERAAALLDRGKRVAILAGQGALGCRQELEELAETLGAPIVKPLLGKGVVPDDSPYTTGGIGLLGTTPSDHVMRHCDTLLIVGSSFPYIEYYPKPGSAASVQIDIDPRRIGLRYPIQVGLVGDSRATLRELLPLLQRNGDRGFLEKAQSDMSDWRRSMDDQASRTDVPMKPQVVAAAVNRHLRDDAIVVTDSGTNTAWFARQIQLREGQDFAVSGTLATMACAVPYAIAAQIAFPRRQVVAFMGDGGFSMLMSEFATAAKYKLPIKVVVLKNDMLGQIKWEQIAFLGNPDYGVDLFPIDFVKVAEACGGHGIHVEDPLVCDAAVEAALASPGPVLVEAVTDPLEIPMPPSLTMQQARNFALAIARGEPAGASMAAGVIAERIREMV